MYTVVVSVLTKSQMSLFPRPAIDATVFWELGISVVSCLQSPPVPAVPQYFQRPQTVVHDKGSTEYGVLIWRSPLHVQVNNKDAWLSPYTGIHANHKRTFLFMLQLKYLEGKKEMKQQGSISSTSLVHSVSSSVPAW